MKTAQLLNAVRAYLALKTLIRESRLRAKEYDDLLADGQLTKEERIVLLEAREEARAAAIEA